MTRSSFCPVARSSSVSLSSHWGHFRAVQMMLCQSGASSGCLRGKDGGEGGGEAEISVQCSFFSSSSSLVHRRFGGLEFHLPDRILSRIAREESAPLVASFIRYMVSLVLPCSDHLWSFLLCSPSGISCRQCPLDVRLAVTLVTVHSVAPISLRTGHHFRSHPSSPGRMSFQMYIARRRRTKRSCSSGTLCRYSMVIMPSSRLYLVVLLA